MNAFTAQQSAMLINGNNGNPKFINEIYYLVTKLNNSLQNWQLLPYSRISWSKVWARSACLITKLHQWVIQDWCNLILVSSRNLNGKTTLGWFFSTLSSPATQCFLLSMAYIVSSSCTWRSSMIWVEERNKERIFYISISGSSNTKMASGNLWSNLSWIQATILWDWFPWSCLVVLYLSMKIQMLAQKIFSSGSGR